MAEEHLRPSIGEASRPRIEARMSTSLDQVQNGPRIKAPIGGVVRGQVLMQVASINVVRPRYKAIVLQGGTRP